MAEMRTVEIKIDQEALKKQVEDAIGEALREASWRLRQAADDLDPEFLYHQRKYIEGEYNRGFEAGKAAK